MKNVENCHKFIRHNYGEQEIPLASAALKNVCFGKTFENHFEFDGHKQA